MLVDAAPCLAPIMLGVKRKVRFMIPDGGADVAVASSSTLGAVAVSIVLGLLLTTLDHLSFLLHRDGGKQQVMSR